MKLSFVIPAYNEENYLTDCLRSIIADTETIRDDVEIIVVNNASIDSTPAVARSFPRVMVVDEPRKGLVRARQTGFDRASGEIIANIDADTRLPRGWTAIVLQEFKARPGVVAISGPYVYYDASPAMRFFVRLHYYGIVYPTYLVNRYILRLGSMIQGGNFAIRRSALEAISGFNPEFDFYGEDADLARRLHKVGSVVFSFKLFAYSSARRLAAEGIVTLGARYVINYVWVMLFKRPFSSKSIDIRPK